MSTKIANNIQNNSTEVKWGSSKDIFVTNIFRIYRASRYMGYVLFLCFFFRETENCFGRGVPYDNDMVTCHVSEVTMLENV